MSSLVSGVLTTLPVICFALIGATTPWLARRFGPHRLTVASLVLMIAGVVARTLVSSSSAFLALSVLALAGGAITNVLMPTLVKRHFPRRISQLTGAYVTALSIGQTLASGLTVPVGSFGGGWRTGLGSWALLAAVAVIPWLWTLRGDHPDQAAATASATARRVTRRMLTSRTAWALTIMYASQSFQGYAAFGWFAKLMSSHGIDGVSAGWMVAVMSTATVPASMFIPMVAPHRYRALATGLVGCSCVSYIGLLVAPTAGAWLWMVLAGIGLGIFPLVLTLIGMRSRVTATTASLSAFVQSMGYVLAGSGPLLFGALRGATGGWTASLLSMLIASVIGLPAAHFACAPRYVDDEL